jgi:hypothetical protein
MNNQGQKQTANQEVEVLNRSLYTLKKFAEKHSSFTSLSAITNQVFKAAPRQSSKGVIPGNGMLDHGVIVKIGRRVLIDEAAYFRWLDSIQDGRKGGEK